jgi:UDP-N-acetylglucosamine 2-epimerase
MGTSHAEILGGLAQVCSSDFRARLRGLVNPYHAGNAAAKIVQALEQVLSEVLSPRQLLLKGFQDQ